MKPLEELSYAELMALFPIVLVPHRDEWREQYAQEKARLLARLPGGDIRLPGDADEVFFRDHLNLRPDLAAEYEQLKLALWKPYEHDRDGYTAAKGDFVRRVTAEAKRHFTAQND